MWRNNLPPGCTNEDIDLHFSDEEQKADYTEEEREDYYYQLWKDG